MRMKDGARHATMIALLVAAVAFGYRTAGAASGCGTRTFGGTTVRECYDAADSYVTFSNACGTQRVDAQAASHGAYPDRLVPCPRPNSPASGGTGSSSGNSRSDDIRSGARNFQEAMDYSRSGDLEAASLSYALAESYYRRAGDSFNAANARRNKTLLICHANMNSKDPDTLRLLLGQGEDPRDKLPPIAPLAADSVAPSSTSRVGACLEFPPETERVRGKLAAVEQEKRNAASTQATGPTVDIHSLRDSQTNCSDITGVGGGPGPANCNSNGAPANLQTRISQARTAMQSAQIMKQADSSKAGQLAAASQFRKAAEAYRDGGQMAQAVSALEDAYALEHAQSCPPPIPRQYWPDGYVDYCEKAKDSCVERASAHYGMLCGPPDDSLTVNTDAGSREICKQAKANLAPHAPDPTWLADRLASVIPPCNWDGTPMTIRDFWQWSKAHNKTYKVD